MRLKTLFAFLLLTTHFNLLFAQSKKDLTVAIVRADGIIVPYAHYNDSTWQRVTDVYDLAGWDGLATWYFTSPQNETEVLYAGTIVEFDLEGMNPGIGMISTLFPKKVLGNSYPRPKVGAALTDNIPFAQFIPVDDSSEWKSLHSFVSKALSEQEGQFVANNLDLAEEKNGIRSVNGIPVNKDIREKTVLRLSISVTDSSLQGIQLYQFNASRKYDNGCGPYPVLEGWIAKENGEYFFVNEPGEYFSLMWCSENKGKLYFDYYGAFEWEGSILIPTQVIPWEGEEHQLIEYRDRKMTFTISSQMGLNR